MHKVYIYMCIFVQNVSYEHPYMCILGSSERTGARGAWHPGAAFSVPDGELSVPEDLRGHPGCGGSAAADRKTGVPEEELQPLVSMLREVNPILSGTAGRFMRPLRPSSGTMVREKWAQYGMFIVLSSGWRLTYVKSRICDNQFGGEGISYCGLTSQEKCERIRSIVKIIKNHRLSEPPQVVRTAQKDP